jgi:hypothetical protein
VIRVGKDSETCVSRAPFWSVLASFIGCEAHPVLGSRGTAQSVPAPSSVQSGRATLQAKKTDEGPDSQALHQEGEEHNPVGQRQQLRPRWEVRRHATDRAAPGGLRPCSASASPTRRSPTGTPESHLETRRLPSEAQTSRASELADGRSGWLVCTKKDRL